MSKIGQMDTLIVVDLQNGVFKDNHNCSELDKFIARINHRIGVYRANNKHVIFIQHNDEELVNGTKEWDFLPNLDHNVNDLYVQKIHANSFYRTNLQKILTEKKLHSFEICGAQTEYCIDTTIKMGHGLGYHIQMERGLSITFDNPFMTAKQTIDFYERIWNHRFLNLISE